jgi:hypothetical protein
VDAHTPVRGGDGDPDSLGFQSSFTISVTADTCAGL